MVMKAEGVLFLLSLLSLSFLSIAFAQPCALPRPRPSFYALPFNFCVIIWEGRNIMDEMEG